MMQYFEEIISIFCQLRLILVIGLFTIIYYFYKTRNIPPGPMGFPYLGYFPFLDPETCHLQLTELSKKYGDVFSFTCTGRLYIHLGSNKSVREAHLTKSDCFSERVQAFQILRLYLKNSLVYLEGDAWKTVRKVFLQLFRERGMYAIKENHAASLYDTVRETIPEISKGESVDLAPIILTKCAKIIRQTLLGNEGMTEKEMIIFNEHYNDALRTMSSVHLLVVGEFARYFIHPFMPGVKEGENSHNIMKRIMKEVIKKHKETFDINNIRNCIDGYFKERITRESKNDPTAKYFTDDCLFVSLTQVIGESVLFTSIFICSFLKVLLEYPEEQEKIYQELIEFVGIDRNPIIEDKNKLSYTNAFISEVMRTTDVFTIFPSLECTKETTIAGYRIPKGAITLYNFWCSSRNPNDYEEPEKFNPSRFISKEGKRRQELPMLFGVGKRSCIGEGYAMNQVFLFLTTIIKNFRLTKPIGEKEGSNLFFYFDKINVVAHPRNGDKIIQEN